MLFLPAAKRLLIGLTLASLAACSVIGGPKYSLEELRSYYGNTSSLLASASGEGNIEHVKSLLKHNPSEREMAYSFFEAIKAGNKDIVRILLNKNDELINWYNENKNYSVYVALSEGELEIADILIEKGAKIEDHLDNNDIYYLLSGGNYRNKSATATVIWLLGKGADVNVKVRGDTPLHNATFHGRLEIVQKLIKAGADVNLRNNQGDTPLYRAALDKAADNNRLEIIQELIKAGADVNLRNNEGDTPLSKATFHGRLEIVQKLIKAGADVNLRNNQGDTPLYDAAFYGYLEIVQELIKAGADVNVKVRGDTPLHNAAENGYLEIVQELIKAGADVNLRNNQGDTPLYYAKDNPYDNRKIIDFLESNGARE